MGTKDYLEEVSQKDPDAVFSSSGGADSEVIFSIIKKYNIPIKSIFFNKEVENPSILKMCIQLKRKAIKA